MEKCCTTKGDFFYCRLIKNVKEQSKAKNRGRKCHARNIPTSIYYIYILILIYGL